MKKIGDVTSTADKNGEFTDGNVTAGTPPTQLMGDWFNSVQREIINVLIKAGVTQSKTKDDQLAEAIGKLIGSAGYQPDGYSYSKVESNLKFQPIGNYLSPGDFGLGGAPGYLPVDKTLVNGFDRSDKTHTNGAFNYWYGITLAWSGAEKTNAKCQIITGIDNRDLYYRFAINETNAPLEFGDAMKILSTWNTSKDKNGFLRASGESTALTTGDIAQDIGTSKEKVPSQFAVNEALKNKQAKGNYLDKDSTSEQLLQSALYAAGDVGAGNPRGNNPSFLLTAIDGNEPQMNTRKSGTAPWLNFKLPLSSGRLSLENTANKNDSGYLICGDTGIIIQWGAVVGCLNDKDYRQFPIPFRERCFQIVTTYAGFNDFGMASSGVVVSNKDFIATSRGSNSNLLNGTVRYIAIGY